MQLAAEEVNGRAGGGGASRKVNEREKREEKRETEKKARERARSLQKEKNR